MTKLYTLLRRIDDQLVDCASRNWDCFWLSFAFACAALGLVFLAIPFWDAISP